MKSMAYELGRDAQADCNLRGRTVAPAINQAVVFKASPGA
jgi:hypothetical protein